MEESTLSFTIRATYDLLPTPMNLNQAQPGPATTADYIGRKKSYHQSPLSPYHRILNITAFIRVGQLPVKPAARVEPTLLDTELN